MFLDGDVEMNTIERVARAIKPELSKREAVIALPDRLDDLMSKRCAHAALNALADGLEWDENDMDLLLNDWSIGIVIGHTTGTFGAWLLDELLSDQYQTLEEAREALMSRARNWIIGLETVTEKG